VDDELHELFSYRLGNGARDDVADLVARNVIGVLDGSGPVTPVG
jgi:hypothetical protein